MILSKIWAIAWNNIYRTYIDRIALLFMILMPIIVSVVMGLAFGNLSSGDIELKESKLLIVNQDIGATTSDGRHINWGQDIFVNVLVDNPSDELAQIITGELTTDLKNARQKVKDGDARAVLIIPADFSSQVITSGETAHLNLFYNPASQVGATVVVSVVESLLANLNTGQAAEEIFVGQGDTSGYFIQLATATGNTQAIQSAITQGLEAVYTQDQSRIIHLQSVNVSGEYEPFEPLRYFAPSMAIFFMAFAVSAGSRSILEESRLWTMQRILTTPTPRWAYMAGKMLGTYLSGIFQMLILLVTMPIIAVVLGDQANIWGDNYLNVALITLAVVFAATGLGLIIAAFSGTPQQADSYGSPVLILMAALGGTFFQLDAAPKFIRALSNLSLNYWGLDGYTKTSFDAAPTTDILTNVAVLFLMGLGFFVIALWRFNRRVDL